MQKFGFLLLLLAALALTACEKGNSDSHQFLSEWLKENGKIKTLSTTCMIGDIVRNVGGEFVDNLTLIAPELDPHSYQLVKGDTEKLQFADLIFYNGLGLEHGPSLHQQLIGNDKAVAVGDIVADMSPEKILTYNGQLDPHIWMDISLWMQTIPPVVHALIKKQPEHAKLFRSRGETLMQEMQEAHRQVRALLQAVPNQKRFLVTSHDAFNYFARAYLATEEEQEKSSWAKRFQAPEGLAPESQLSSWDIQFILDHLVRYQIHVIFPESNVSRDSIRKVVQAAQGSGLEVFIADVSLYGDAMGRPGSEGDTYLKMITHNANVLAQHMNGKKKQ